ncbi:MAG TPA: hypothetical protein VIH72_01665 [Candidatus Acidoferrales bacterium]
MTVSLAGLVVNDGGEFDGGGLGEGGGSVGGGGEGNDEVASIFAPLTIPEHPDMNKTGIARSV